MRIESFRVVNYKSFADSGSIRLEPGFNVIVGRNNVGKTALAEAVGLRFRDKPHRSTKTVRRVGAEPTDTTSQAEVSIRVEADELAELLASELPNFYAPTDPNRPDAGEAWLQTALSEGVTVEALYRNQNLLSARLASYPESPPDVYLQFTVDESGKPTRIAAVHGTPSDTPILAIVLAIKFFERLYSFSAVRFDIRENPIGINRNLSPNASDLVQVLALLSTNSSRWNRHFKEIKVVLPEIEAISFPPQRAERRKR